MKKLIVLISLLLACSIPAYAGVKDKALELPNATASLVNKVATGTNDNATALVGGVNNTLHSVASDLNNFGKACYHFITGQEV